MLLINRLVSQKIFKMNFNRFSKFFMPQRPIWNKFVHIKTSVVFRKNELDLCCKRINYRKYSTGKSHVGDILKEGDSDKEMMESNIENEDEGESEYCSDSDIESDDDDDDDDEEEEEEKEEDRNRNIEKIFEEIAHGDPKVMKSLKLIQFEMALLKEQGNKVPKNLTISQWKELLKTPSSKKKQLLTFMSLNETLNIIKLKKKKIKAQKALKRKADSGFHFYGLGGHTMFLRVYDKSLNRLLFHRLLSSKQKILFDCSYQEFMNDTCIKQVAKQIHMTISEVKMHRYPCQVAFCSLDKNDRLGKIIPKYVAQIFDENFFCDVSSQSILDIYPKEKLLYLSPHAPNDLMEFNKDDICVIGAYVDKGSSVKASLAKAKKDNIRMAKLPLDYYMCWKQGNKALPLNTVVRILLDMSFYNDWNKAFSCISNRLKNDFYSKMTFSDTREFRDTNEFSEIKLSSTSATHKRMY